MQRDSNYLLNPDLQECVEITSPSNSVEAGTSNEVVNEINLKPKSIISDVSSQKD